MPTGNRSNLRSGIHALLLCILLLAVLVACNQTPAESTNPPVPDATLAATEPESPPAAPSVTPIIVSPIEPGSQSPEEIQAVLVTALMALNERPNRMDVSTLLVDGGETRTNLIEFVPPDRKRIVSEQEGIEYIIVDNVVYARTETSGDWQQTALPASTFMQESEVTEESVASTISDAIVPAHGHAGWQTGQRLQLSQLGGHQRGGSREPDRGVDRGTGWLALQDVHGRADPFRVDQPQHRQERAEGSAGSYHHPDRLR